MLKRMVFILTPFLLLVSIAFLSPVSQEISPNYQSIISLFPYAAIGLGAVLAWRFNRSQVFFLLFILSLLFLGNTLTTELADHTTQNALFFSSILLPLNVFIIGFFRERGIFTQHGILRFALFAGQAILVWWLVQQDNLPWLSVMQSNWLSVAWLIDNQQGITQFSWLLTLLVVLWQIVRVIKKPLIHESAILLTLLIVTLAFCVRENQIQFFLLFGLAAVILIISLIQESYGMAYIDELTGLPGRRSMMNTLMSLGNRYSIAMIDIDHFKKFNDTHGHDIGDQVLRMVAGKIGEVTGGGRPARYGGEEFSIIFPGKSISDVFAHLEVVRQKIEESPFAIRGKDRPRRKPDNGAKRRVRKPKQVTVTVSIGVAERTEKNSSPEVVMKAADKALYRAKDKGRNQVCK